MEWEFKVGTPKPHVKYLAEFIGTFFLVFTVGCNVHTGSIGAAISIGAILMVMVYSLGSVSGAHLNPAVTMAIGLSGRGKISLQDLLCYMVAQICGGLVGALTYLTVFGDAFLLKPLFNYSVTDTVVVEMLYSMALCYVVLNVATTEHRKQGNVPNDFFGLAIGLTVTAAAITIGPISGCSLNPAVSIGSFVAASMADHSLSTGMCFVYNATPFLGSALAALFFYFVQGGLTDRFEYEAGFQAPSPAPTPRPLPRRTRRATYTHGHYLRKGSVFEISKEQETHVLQIGVKWEVPEESQADIDMTCTKFNKEGQLHEAVYFAAPKGDLSHREKSTKEPIIVHNGDNVTGSGHGLVSGFISSMKKKDDTDDERIVIRQLTKLQSQEPSAQYMFFTLNVFSAGDGFAKLKSLRIRIVDAGRSGHESTEICRFEKDKMPDSNSNAFILCVLYHKNGRWLFEVLDEIKSIKKASYEHGTYRDLQPRLEAVVRMIEESEIEEP